MLSVTLRYGNSVSVTGLRFVLQLFVPCFLTDQTHFFQKRIKMTPRKKGTLSLYEEGVWSGGEAKMALATRGSVKGFRSGARLFKYRSK